jgi:quinol monooxygenase YgiN
VATGRSGTCREHGTSGNSETELTNEEINMTVTLGLLAQLEAQPGKGGELGAFLQAGRTLALAEEGTVTWYAFKLDDTHYGIFDTFETEAARQAHIDGEIPKALAAVAEDLLASEPDIRAIDVIAVM